MGIHSHSFSLAEISIQMYAKCPSSRAQSLCARKSGQMSLRPPERQEQHIPRLALRSQQKQNSSDQTNLQRGPYRLLPNPILEGEGPGWDQGGGLEGIQPHVLVLGPREEEVAALEDLSLSFLKVINGSRGQLGLFLQFVIYQGHLDIWEHLGLFGHLRLLLKCPPVFPNVRFPNFPRLK